MSEYSVVKLTMNDRDCIVKSLEELGYKCEVHDSPQHLIGYIGDQRKQKANIIVRRNAINSASNDIGFLRLENGNYEMIISEFDVRASHGINFTEKLNQIYSKNKVIQKARAMGYSVSSQSTDQDGRLRIRIKTR